VFKSERNCGEVFKTRRLPSSRNKKNTRGVVNSRNPFSKDKTLSTQDILWAVGIWSVILTLSPVVVFYVLMVN
jgi:hypothetical protein